MPVQLAVGPVGVQYVVTRRPIVPVEMIPGNRTKKSLTQLLVE